MFQCFYLIERKSEILIETFSYILIYDSDSCISTTVYLVLIIFYIIVEESHVFQYFLYILGY